MLSLRTVGGGKSERFGLGGSQSVAMCSTICHSRARAKHKGGAAKGERLLAEPAFWNPSRRGNVMGTLVRWTVRRTRALGDYLSPTRAPSGCASNPCS
jgi:hypothetical protein